jgi:DNA polymerase I-like protein with 3'-5' exonuclease and polymerase domains
VNVVHDEIIIDAARDEVPFVMENVPAWMDYPKVSEHVPILVDREISWTTWANKEEYV